MEKILIFSVITLILLSSTMILPDAYAKDTSFISECIGDVWRATVYDDDGEPFPNVKVMTMTKQFATNYEEKFITDENGIVEIPYDSNTGFVWISKGGYNDQKTVIEKCQKAPSYDSPVQENNKKKITEESEGGILPPPRPINPEEKEYVESMNIMGKIVQIFDDKICVEEFCKSTNKLPVHIEGNVGMNVQSSIKLQIKYCQTNYLIPCLEYSGIENPIVSEIRAKNNGGGNFYADWTIRKGMATGLYEIKGVVDGAVTGQVGNTMFDVVKGNLNGLVVVLNNVKVIGLEDITQVTKQNSSITISKITHDGDGNGTINYEICAKTNLENPSFMIISDVSKTSVLNEIKLEEGQCHTGKYTIKALLPSSISIPFATIASSSSELDALKAEIDELKKLIEKKEKVPTWVKNNAKWWANDEVDDNTFVNGIGFLIKEKIIEVDAVTQQSPEKIEEQVPGWIKNNAAWWADGKISEDDFIMGIKYLVEKGIIKVT